MSEPSKKTPKRTPAEAAALEANTDDPEAAAAPAAEDAPLPDGMVKVPFRGVDLVVPGPARWAKSFAIRMALASGRDDQLMYAILGDGNTSLVSRLINEDTDDFVAIVGEFFQAYNEVTEATGEGNS